MAPYVSVVSFVFLVVLLALCSGQNDNQLPFLHVESSGEPAGQSNYSLAVQLAVGDINRNGAILQQYTLSAVNRATMDTQVSNCQIVLILRTARLYADGRRWVILFMTIIELVKVTATYHNTAVTAVNRLCCLCVNADGINVMQLLYIFPNGHI